MFEAHFQSFEDRSERAASAPRVAALRAELAKRGLDGFIVPRADRFQNEYVPPCAEQLAWLTGFTGSAGIAIVLADRAVIFVDGRYQVQVREEIDGTIFAVAHWSKSRRRRGSKTICRRGAKLGYSPWLHTVEGAERLAKACAAARAMLVPVEDNPIDAIWTDRPQPPLGAVVPHDLRYAGEDAAAKLARLHAEMEKISADALVVSDPHERVVAVQHPRQRRAAHAGGARLRHGAQGGPAGALCRPAQARQRHALPPRRDCRRARQRRLRARSCRARQGASRRAARSRDLPRGDRAPRRRERRQDRARQRSDRADEGGEERGRDRRRPRGATARRRRGDAISGLVRPRSAAWH